MARVPVVTRSFYKTSAVATAISIEDGKPVILKEEKFEIPGKYEATDAKMLKAAKEALGIKDLVTVREAYVSLVTYEMPVSVFLEHATEVTEKE